VRGISQMRKRIEVQAFTGSALIGGYFKPISFKEVT
jgi:hypothetical protein